MQKNGTNKANKTTVSLDDWGFKMENIVGKIAKGYSDTCQKYVEGKIYYHYSNGIGILTDGGIVFVENGKYEIIED